VAQGKQQGPKGIDPLTKWLGFQWEAPNRIRLEIRDDHINQAGLLSGAVSYALIDYCMGSTLWIERKGAERIATISISINYVQTAREGTIVCESTLDRRNDRVAVLRSEVRHEDGRLVATAVGSFAIFPKERLRGQERRRDYVPGD
jgi:uncharacterized protein (TIGR00369 family)